MAGRYVSAITILQGLWYFMTPFLYFGASEQPNGWNEWIAATLVISFAATRMLFPAKTTILATANAIIALWIIASPWIVGFSDYTSRTVNSLVIGTAILGFSLFSRSFTKVLKPGYREGREHADPEVD